MVARSGDDRIPGELSQANDGFGPQRGGIARNRGLTGPLRVRHSPVQGPNQFMKPACQLTSAQRHRAPRFGPDTRRDGFQISPQAPHRQYALASGFRAVVVIAGDWQAGHAAGVVTASAARDRSATSRLNWGESTEPPEHVEPRSTAKQRVDDHRRDDDRNRRGERHPSTDGTLAGGTLRLPRGPALLETRRLRCCC